MNNTKKTCLVASVVLILLTFSAILYNQQVNARDLRAPVLFTKFSPIDQSAFQSVWTISLSWTDSVGATDYEYCFDKTNDDTCNDSWISTGMDTFAEITFLEADTTYYWQARAYSGSVYTEADEGTWWSFTTGGYARFHVELIENRIEGYDWRPGNSVTVTVDDPSNGIGVDFTATKTVDPYGKVVFPSPPGLQLGTGMVVTMNDGVVYKSHTVISLQVTNIDIDADTLTGTGEIGARVNAQYCQYNGCLWRRSATIQGDGTWQVNFSVAGSGPDEQEILDLVPGTPGEVIIGDFDGDHTDVYWYIYQRFDTHPLEDFVDGSGWIVDSTVTIEIYESSARGAPDYTDTTTVIVNPGDPNSTYFHFDLSGVFDLYAGQLVSITDGSTTKTHTVTNPHILMANAATDEFSGIAAPNSYIDLQTCGMSGCYSRTAQADSNGYWSANFGVVGDQPWEQTILDILPDTQGILRQWDDDTDTTMIPWTAKDYVFLPVIIH